MPPPWFATSTATAPAVSRRPNPYHAIRRQREAARHAADCLPALPHLRRRLHRACCWVHQPVESLPGARCTATWTACSAGTAARPAPRPTGPGPGIRRARSRPSTTAGASAGAARQPSEVHLERQLAAGPPGRGRQADPLGDESPFRSRCPRRRIERVEARYDHGMLTDGPGRREREEDPRDVTHREPEDRLTSFPKGGGDRSPPPIAPRAAVTAVGTRARGSRSRSTLIRDGWWPWPLQHTSSWRPRSRSSTGRRRRPRRRPQASRRPRSGHRRRRRRWSSPSGRPQPRVEPPSAATRFRGEDLFRGDEVRFFRGRRPRRPAAEDRGLTPAASTGTGFGSILTNNHVVEGATRRSSS